jgi:hypothetical protein
MDYRLTRLGMGQNIILIFFVKKSVFYLFVSKTLFSFETK